MGTPHCAFDMEETYNTPNDQRSLQGGDSGPAWLGRKAFVVDCDTNRKNGKEKVEKQGGGSVKDP